MKSLLTFIDLSATILLKTIIAMFMLRCPKPTAATLLLMSGWTFSMNAQLTSPEQSAARGLQLSAISVAVPFLMIAPDARAAAMGESGVANAHPEAAMHWNPAIMSTTENDVSISATYAPWFSAVLPRVHFAYLSGVKRIGSRHVVGSSVRLLHQFQRSSPVGLGTSEKVYPREWSVDFGYAFRLNAHWHLGAAARLVNSNLMTKPNGQPGKQAPAFDFGAFRNVQTTLGSKPGFWNLGLNISNIGTKRGYASVLRVDFLPANLRLGSAMGIDLSKGHRLVVTADANKLLVPSEPIYKKSNGQFVLDSNGNYVIAAGKNPDVNAIQGMMQSFTDAPGVPIRDPNGNITGTERGSVLREEIREINFSAGMEYVALSRFAARVGYFQEHFSKGNRSHLTLGAGFKFQSFSLEVSYLLATTSYNPMGNTFRATAILVL